MGGLSVSKKKIKRKRQEGICRFVIEYGKGSGRGRWAAIEASSVQHVLKGWSGTN